MADVERRREMNLETRKGVKRMRRYLILYLLHSTGYEFFSKEYHVNESK